MSQSQLRLAVLAASCSPDGLLQGQRQVPTARGLVWWRSQLVFHIDVLEWGFEPQLGGPQAGRPQEDQATNERPIVVLKTLVQRGRHVDSLISKDGGVMDSKHSPRFLILMTKVNLLQLIIKLGVYALDNSCKISKTAFQSPFDSPMP
ncbi:MAG: hypothetical protein FRX48_05361 [Lasallia pustulata]|uniref:Uncharacterized protein n=1 Tax=Lasallia pustulata TaxID=136370 RepID=A0A5M8PQ62_9LECA|nr:MAG: hypothetical protein FRX48_05361 [Lasallia pustulata]